MRNNIMCIAVMVFCLHLLIYANIVSTNTQSDFFKNATTLSVKSHIEKDAGIRYGTVQGGCTDTKYAYFAINTDKTTLLKYELATFKLIKVKKDVTLGHANDMTYNKKLNSIIIANNSPDYKHISFVDPNTLKITSTKKIDHKIYSIAYNSSYDKYVVGLSGSYDFAILDNKFKLVKKYEGYKSGYLRQGGDCDDTFLYFTQSGIHNNILVIYDWNGKLVDVVSINKSLEIENIFHNKNEFYVTFNRMGSFVYKIGINDKFTI